MMTDEQDITEAKKKKAAAAKPEATNKSKTQPQKAKKPTKNAEAETQDEIKDSATVQTSVEDDSKTRLSDQKKQK